MSDDRFGRVEKQSLSDSLALRIGRMIRTGEYREGDRLPSIMEMARRFGVGHPSVREALKKLEAVGALEIRHGSGVYVGRNQEMLVLASPIFSGEVTKKLLVDLVRARIPIELQSVTYAARNAGEEELREMRRLLDTAEASFADDAALNEANMGFHRQIALASGNTVLLQLLGVMQELFSAEQALILSIFGSRERDHEEHLGILDALERRDEALAVQRMRKHLEGVEEALLRWDPEAHPVR